MAVKKKKGNLTQKPGCYSYELNKYIDLISKAAADNTITTEMLRAFVLKKIEPAFIVNKAKPAFIARIKQAPSKGWIVRYVLDAIANGKKVICNLD